MTHRGGPHFVDGSGNEIPVEPRTVAVYAEAAAFYVACLKGGFTDEAGEFQEWFLETFDVDLED